MTTKPRRKMVVLNLELDQVLVTYNSLAEYRKDAEQRNKNFTNFRTFIYEPSSLVEMEVVVSNN